MRAPLRTFLFLHALALAATAGVAVLALALPLSARRALGPGDVAAVALAAALAVLAVALVLLHRGVARPVERLLAAAVRLGGGEGGEAEALPLLGVPGGFDLSRAAIAFERLALAFGDERERLAAKVRELTAANAALAEARASLVRSEKLATVGRLASGLAHEVGNPLGAVSGYVELARARLPPEPHPDLVDALARIDTAAQRIDRTVRDLLDFARPAPPVLAPIDLAAALAARAASGGVVLTVRDSGPGIAPADLARIFDPFFTTKEPGEGTGLGLALSHRIMESFGGEIAARDAPGGGACFELRFRAGAPASLS